MFVHGIRRRKTQLQKSLEQLDQYLKKLKEYTKKLYTQDRNSYSKTDPDATFMKKEDAMLNGQLKPAYNIQHGVNSNTSWIDISPHPTDTYPDPVFERHGESLGI